MSFAEIDSPDHDKGKAAVQAGPHGINSGSATDNKKLYWTSPCAHDLG